MLSYPSAGRRPDHRIKHLVGLSIVADLKGLFEMADAFRRPPLSPNARKRLAWFDYHRTAQSVAHTCRHFGISRKTFYAWYKRYDRENLASLEDGLSIPKKKRQREVTAVQEMRIVQLRRLHIRYGKEKLAIIYAREYHEKISCWKIQKVIEKYRLYFHPLKVERARKRRQAAWKKKRITELAKVPRRGFLIAIDSIVIYFASVKRYVITAVDTVTKVAFARMYATGSSMNAADFLQRLFYLLDGEIENIQTDNGSEFKKYFGEAAAALKLEHYFSRPRTPKDNAMDERFNRTIQEEFIKLGNFHSDPKVFNPRLTEWLVEYNFRRPHHSLKYETPIERACPKAELLPTYSSHTCA